MAYTTAQLTKLVTELQAQVAALQPRCTPFTPASAPSLLAGFTTPASFAKLPAWQSTGSAPAKLTLPDPNAPTAAPLIQKQGVYFNNSPLLGELPRLGAFTVFLPVYLATLDQDGLLLAQGDLYGFDLAISRGSFTASVYQRDGRQLATPAREGWNFVVLSRSEDNVVRLAANGGDSVQSRDFDPAETGGALYVGGRRTSDGKVQRGVKAWIPEFYIFGEQSMPLQRKLEGYGRVTYGVKLPAGHRYATEAPIVEAVAEDSVVYRDADGNPLDVRHGVLYSYYGPYSYAYTESHQVTEWVDGSPLTIDRIDPRTQGEIGDKLYTVAFTDDGAPLYFEPEWVAGKIDLRVFGITPGSEDNSRILRQVFAYFPQGYNEDFRQKGRQPHFYAEGVAAENQGHWIYGDSDNKKAVIVVPAGVVGISSLCRNGIKGMGGRYLSVRAAGKDPHDNPVPVDLVPLRGFMAGDYAYKLNWHGLFFDSVVDFKYCEFSGFSGMVAKGQARINKNDPNDPANRNASNSKLSHIEAGDCWGGLLLNGADCNAVDTAYWSVRDMPGISLIDDSLEGGRHSRWTSHSVAMGHYMARGAGNAASLSKMYGEVQWFAEGDPAQPFHGSYLAGSATMIGGVVSPDGSGRPGSPVFTQGNAQIINGNYTSGIKSGAVTMHKHGLDFDGGPTLAREQLPTGQWRWALGFGYAFTANVLEFMVPGLPLQGGNRTAQDFFVNLINPAVNGLRVHVANQLADVEELKERDGRPVLFAPGDKVQLRNGQNIVCETGGQYLGDEEKHYETGLTGHMQQLPTGAWAFQIDGDQPIPPIGCTLVLNSVAYHTISGDLSRRLYTISASEAPEGLDLKKDVTYSITLARPAFRAVATLDS